MSKIIAAVCVEAKRRTAGTLRRSTRRLPAVSRSTIAPPTSNRVRGGDHRPGGFGDAGGKSADDRCVVCVRRLDVEGNLFGATWSKPHRPRRQAELNFLAVGHRCIDEHSCRSDRTPSPSRRHRRAQRQPSAVSSLRRHRCWVRRSTSCLVAEASLVPVSRSTARSAATRTQLRRMLKRSVIRRPASWVCSEEPPAARAQPARGRSAKNPARTTRGASSSMPVSARSTSPGRGVVFPPRRSVMVIGQQLAYETGLPQRLFAFADPDVDQRGALRRRAS